jgi:hypothetical protein
MTLTTSPQVIDMALVDPYPTYPDVQLALRDPVFLQVLYVAA